MSSPTAESPNFKTCSMCKTTWESIALFLGDPCVSFNGFQANFDIFDEGIFFFTHDEESCGSTMALKVHRFSSLYSGPRYTTSRQLSSDCPSYCLDKKMLHRCAAQCENAFARELSQIIKDTMAVRAGPRLIPSNCKTNPRVMELR